MNANVLESLDVKSPFNVVQFVVSLVNARQEIVKQSIGFADVLGM